MGKSIYNQIVEGVCEINDKGETYNTELPKFLRGIDMEAIQTIEGIQETLDAEDIVLLVHAGVRESLIGFRSKFRANEKLETGKKASREELDGWKPGKLTKPVISKKVSEDAALAKLAESYGMTIEQLQKVLASAGAEGK